MEVLPSSSDQDTNDLNLFKNKSLDMSLLLPHFHFFCAFFLFWLILLMGMELSAEAIKLLISLLV